MAVPEDFSGRPLDLFLGPSREGTIQKATSALRLRQLPTDTDTIVAGTPRCPWLEQSIPHQVKGPGTSPRGPPSFCLFSLGQ